MVNPSKLKEQRFWKRWAESGAVASVSGKDEKFYAEPYVGAQVVMPLGSESRLEVGAGYSIGVDARKPASIDISCGFGIKF